MVLIMGMMWYSRNVLSGSQAVEMFGKGKRGVRLTGKHERIVFGQTGYVDEVKRVKTFSFRKSTLIPVFTRVTVIQVRDGPSRRIIEVVSGGKERFGTSG